MSRLIHDIETNQSKRIFEILLSDTDTFKGFSIADIEEMMQVMKILQIKK